jgi:hypothetical protein
MHGNYSQSKHDRAITRAFRVLNSRGDERPILASPVIYKTSPVIYKTSEVTMERISKKMSKAMLKIKKRKVKERTGNPFNDDDQVTTGHAKLLNRHFLYNYSAGHLNANNLPTSSHRFRFVSPTIHEPIRYH